MQSSSHDFGEFVQYVIRSPAYNQTFNFHDDVLSKSKPYSAYTNRHLMCYPDSFRYGQIMFLV